MFSQATPDTTGMYLTKFNILTTMREMVSEDSHKVEEKRHWVREHVNLKEKFSRNRHK
jgi:hypothetical protein